MFLQSLLHFGIIVAGVISDTHNGFPKYDYKITKLCHNATVEKCVCLTEACHELDETIQNSMNPLFDPCTDFYEYGCGNWPRNNPVPPHELEWSTIENIQHKTYRRIKDFLEKRNEHDQIPFIKKVKQYYHSCMDEDAIENRGLEPIKLLLNATGGWPIAMPKGKWDGKRHPWQTVDNIYNRLYGFSSFFGLRNVADEQNFSRNILVIDYNLRYSKRLDDLYAYSYVDLITNVIMALIKDNKIKIPMKELRINVADLIEFEKKVEYIYKNIKKKTQRVSEESVMTIAEFQEYYDLEGTQQSTAMIDWLHMIQFIFQDHNISINASERILVYDKEFFHDLARLLYATPVYIIVNYIQWNIVSKLLGNLNKQMRDIEFEYKYPSYIMIEPDPRWLTCIRDLLENDVIPYIFAKTYISENTWKTILKIIDEIKEEIKERVSHSLWISNYTKNKMINKINSISHVDYSELYNQTTLIERYKELEIGKNYFENWLAILKHENKKVRTQFYKSKNKSIIHPLNVNAYYYIMSNMIEISAPLIQDPYFTPHIPIAINYGAIVTIIGHELAHSLNWGTIGIHSRTNKCGRITHLYIDPERSAYTERAQCFVHQYSNFTLNIKDEDGKPIHLHGEMTIKESLADLIGIEAAFAVFQKTKAKTKSQLMSLQLVNITDDKLFFLSHVNLLCESRRFHQANIINDNHSPKKFRVLGSLSNMMSFSEVFNCPLGSPMNPKLKCEIWN